MTCKYLDHDNEDGEPYCRVKENWIFFTECRDCPSFVPEREDPDDMPPIKGFINESELPQCARFCGTQGRRARRGGF
ncbi:MAG: hypothetical protein ACYTEQ_24840 [Planctomycetota bacterium]|jgi:hypothetical protein